MKIIITIVLVIAILIGGYLLFNRARLNENLENSSVLSNEEFNVDENIIFVPDQEPGQTVMVALADISSPSFIAIHEDNAGKPGKIIGISELLEPGQKTQFNILLERETKENETLFAVIRKDNGDRIFKPLSDSAVKDPDNNEVSIKFLIISADTE